MIGAATVFRNDVVDCEIAKRELAAAAVAPALLLARQCVFVPAARRWLVDVGAPAIAPIARRTAHQAITAFAMNWESLLVDLDVLLSQLLNDIVAESVHRGMVDDAQELLTCFREDSFPNIQK